MKSGIKLKAIYCNPQHAPYLTGLRLSQNIGTCIFSYVNQTKNYDNKAQQNSRAEAGKLFCTAGLKPTTYVFKYFSPVK